VTYISLHERTDRVIGSTDIGRFFDYDVEHIKVGTQVSILVFGRNEVGAQVVVENRYRGIVYHNETNKQLRVGDTHTAFVKAIREDDRLDISLRRNGHDATLDAKEVLLEAIRSAGGRLSLHDKSPPEAIRERLDMSKKLFKRAVGGLYKEGLISLEEDGISLRDPGSVKQSRD